MHYLFIFFSLTVNFGEDEFYFVGQVMVDQNDMHGWFPFSGQLQEPQK